MAKKITPKKITEQDLIFQMQKAESFAEGYKTGYNTAMNHIAQLQNALEKANNGKTIVETDTVPAKASK